jgi:putative ABC transport system permease protein
MLNRCSRSRVVGVFEPADLQDIYWYQSINTLRQTLIMDQDLLESLVAEHDTMLWSEHLIYAGYDYYQFRIQDVGQLSDVNRTGVRLADEQSRTTRFSTTTFYSVVESYIQREAELKLTLQILIVPILLMLVFYIFMVSQLMVNSETNVSSLFWKAAVPGRAQTLAIYAMESLILGVITIDHRTFTRPVDGSGNRGRQWLPGICQPVCLACRTGQPGHLVWRHRCIAVYADNTAACLYPGPQVDC